MKKIIFAIALAVVATACHRGEEPAAAEQGTLAVRLATTGAVNDESGVTPVAVPDVQSFGLLISEPSGEELYRGTVGESDATTLYDMGDKLVRIWSGDITVEGYDKPYFEGEATVTVQGYGIATDVQVDVAVANAALAIETTELFDGYFRTAEFIVETAHNPSGIAYDATAGLLFVAPAAVTVRCIAEGPTGTKYDLRQTTPLLEPQRRNIVRFDMQTAGNVQLNISLNDEVIATEVIEVELNDRA